MPPLCKGRCHGINRDGGIVLLNKLPFMPQGLPKVNLPSFSIGNARFREAILANSPSLQSNTRGFLRRKYSHSLWYCFPLFPKSAKTSPFFPLFQSKMSDFIIYFLTKLHKIRKILNILYQEYMILLYFNILCVKIIMKITESYFRSKRKN